MNPFKDATVYLRLFLGVLHNSLAASAWRIKMLQTQEREARIKSHIMWTRGTSARSFWLGMGDCSLTKVLYSGCSSICWGGDGRRQGVGVMQSVWGCTSQGGRKAALALRSLGAEQQMKIEVTLRQIPTQYQMAWRLRNLGPSKQMVSLCRSGWTSASTHSILDTLPRRNLTLPLWPGLLDHFFADEWSSRNRGWMTYPWSLSRQMVKPFLGPPKSSGASLVSIKAACHGKQANRGRMIKHEGAKNSIWLTWTIPIHQKQNDTKMNMW